VRGRVAALVALTAAGLLAAGLIVPRAAEAEGPACAPGQPPVVFTGSVGPQDAKTYRTLPFEVGPGTTRVEVGYSWADVVPLPGIPVVDGLVQTVFDLGLWDQRGVGTAAGFRGWSGSRQGKVAEGQDPIWVQADTAERGYRPGPVEPGTWNVDLGIAAVAPTGATYEVTVRCLDPAVGAPFVAQPVDADHVARDEPGWYDGDLHLHAFHSHPSGPGPDEMIEFARAAGLDFVPVTEYVTDQHHRELGPIQAANPDLLLWPGREVITYFGHAIVLGETPHVADWRHGAPGVSLRGIQDASVADGALFGVAHPTVFPTALFASFCRGCEFTLADSIDWDRVTTLEVSTGPVMVDSTAAGLPDAGVEIQNPFIITAMELWQRLLREGHKITAVSGSDDKRGPDYGTAVTSVYARELSRAALQESLRSGHAYVRLRGATDSPTVEVTGTTGDGQSGIVGDTLYADAATVTVRVRGAAGQLLAITADGLPVGVVPITGDDITHTFQASRLPTAGPLGTFWRVDTFDLESLTTIGNPIFLQDPARRPAPSPPTTATSAPPGAGRLPATGGGGALPLGLAATLVAAGGLAVARRRDERGTGPATTLRGHG
jgi:MprA protease rhombosortase-interaction domain-containing protein